MVKMIHSGQSTTSMYCTCWFERLFSKYRVCISWDTAMKKRKPSTDGWRVRTSDIWKSAAAGRRRQLTSGQFWRTQRLTETASRIHQKSCIPSFYGRFSYIYSLYNTIFRFISISLTYLLFQKHRVFLILRWFHPYLQHLGQRLSVPGVLQGFLCKIKHKTLERCLDYSQGTCLWMEESVCWLDMWLNMELRECECNICV